MQVFLTFAAVCNRKLSKHTNDLLAYGAIIVKDVKEYKRQGCLSYDFQFRSLVAAKGKIEGWGQQDMGLWNNTVSKSTISESAVKSDSIIIKDKKEFPAKIICRLGQGAMLAKLNLESVYCIFLVHSHNTNNNE